MHIDERNRSPCQLAERCSCYATPPSTLAGPEIKLSTVAEPLGAAHGRRGPTRDARFVVIFYFIYDETAPRV